MTLFPFILITLSPPGGSLSSNKTVIVLIMSSSLPLYSHTGSRQNEESLYTAGLRVNPMNVKLLNNMARIEESRQNIGSAITYYEKALEIENQSLRTFVNLGNLYSRIGKLEEAKAVLFKAKEVVQEEFYEQKRTSRLQVTTLTRLLQLLSLDPGEDNKEEIEDIQRLLNIISVAESSNGHVSSQLMKRGIKR